jgi:hypothetical protein
MRKTRATDTETRHNILEKGRFYWPITAKLMPI